MAEEIKVQGAHCSFIIFDFKDKPTNEKQWQQK